MPFANYSKSFVVEFLIHPDAQNIAVLVPDILVLSIYIVRPNNTPIQTMLLTSNLYIHFTGIFCYTIRIYRIGLVCLAEGRGSNAIYRHARSKDQSFYAI